MPPEPLPITHDQAPRVLKVSAKIAVPIRKTMNPTILNLMKRKSHFHAVAPKLCLAGLFTFDHAPNLLYITQNHTHYLSNQQSSFFFKKNCKREEELGGTNGARAKLTQCNKRFDAD
jgi:hypothetical protein